MFVVVCTNEWC